MSHRLQSERHQTVGPFKTARLFILATLSELTDHLNGSASIQIGLGLQANCPLGVLPWKAWQLTDCFNAVADVLELISNVKRLRIWKEASEVFTPSSSVLLIFCSGCPTQGGELPWRSVS